MMEVHIGQAITWIHFIVSRSRNVRYSILREIGPPHLLINTAFRRAGFLFVYGYGESELEVRKLRGAKCRNVSAFMNEVSAALQFFGGFGENLHALEEMLCYLDEWMPANGYVIVITRAEEVFADEPKNREWLVDLLQRVGEWWSEPIKDGAVQFRRSAMPFKVVLELRDDDSEWVSLLKAQKIPFEYLQTPDEE